MAVGKVTNSKQNLKIKRMQEHPTKLAAVAKISEDHHDDKSHPLDQHKQQRNVHKYIYSYPMS